MTGTLNLVLYFVFQLVMLLFIARFLLQASRADFYNPLSQAIVKATDAVCKPIRLLLKPIGNYDIASLLTAWLIAVLYAALTNWLANGLFNPLALVWAGVIWTLLEITQFYLFSIFIVIIASFLAQGTYHPVLGLLQQIIDPLMAPFRRIIPPLGPLDLSPMVVILLIFVIQNLLRQAQ